jgi:HD-like signal output (HDOD) protein
MASAAEFVANVKDLPVMPPVAAEVMRKAEDPETRVSDLAELIGRDASLAVRVLRIANSSVYSLPRKVESLQPAIVLLGYATLRSLVVAASMKEVFARFGLAERLLWEHALAGGLATSLLARHVRGLPADELFVAGLVHDVGRLVIHSQAALQYQPVLAAVYNEDADPVPLERQLLGFDHTEVGRLVLEKWRLPAHLAQAVGAHHDPERAGEEPRERALAAALQLADRLCLREGLGRRKPNAELRPLDCAGAQLLGLADLDVDELGAELRQRVEQEKALLG